MRAGARGLVGVYFAALMGGSGCGDNGPPPLVPVPTGPLELTQSEFAPKGVTLGQVAAVSELGSDTLVLSDQGALLFTSGVLLAQDGNIKAWGSSAGVIPAADLAGEWQAAVSADGRVFRLRNRANMEDISDRYGLKGTPVREVVGLGKGRTAFALTGSLAVANGKEVRRYEGVYSGVSGANGRVATPGPDGVRVLEPESGALDFYPLPGAVAAAFDPMGRLVAATAEGLYQQSEGEDRVLKKIYQTTGTPIRMLTGAPTGVWVVIGDAAALLQGGMLKMGPQGMVPQGARLYGTPTGDVWALGGAKLVRLAQKGEGGADEDVWKKNVLPIFTRLCALCHLPGGSAGIDYSTYRSWANSRALMQKRVVDGKPSPMPPAGAGMLTVDEMAALKEWLDAGK
jgi:mono/diheme cytochrome c family protein